MKFSKEFLVNTLYEYGDGGEKISDEVYDTTRWSILSEMIFKFKDRFYLVCYSRGATEQQMEEPFEYDGDEIECQEVQQVEKVVLVGEAVK